MDTVGDWKTLITELKYIEPSKETKQIMLLGFLIENYRYTQRELATLIRITPSQVNVYLKELLQRQYVSSISEGKAKRYIVTESGKWFYRVGMFRLLRELGTLFVSMEVLFSDVKAPLEQYTDVVLYGAGEICQMLIPLLRVWGKRVPVVIDDFSHSKQCMDVPVRQVNEVYEYGHLPLIIASFSSKEQMLSKISGVWRGPIYTFFFDDVEGRVGLKIAGGGKNAV